MGKHRRGSERVWTQWENEFNDLLTPILGYSEFLQTQLGPESEFSQDIQEIYLAARRMQRLGERMFLNSAGRKTQLIRYSGPQLRVTSQPIQNQNGPEGKSEQLFTVKQEQNKEEM